MKKQLLGFIILLLAGLPVWAVPAYPELIAFRQPNHDITVNIYLKGDEKVHWAETEDGYALIHNDDGDLVYAVRDAKGDLMPSAFIATNKEDRPDEVVRLLETTPRHLTFSAAQVKQMLALWDDVSQMKHGPKTMTDVVGEKRFLVVLFEFQDLSFTHRRQEFVNLFNQVGYAVNRATGSVHDYYSDVSNGQFQLTVDVVGPYKGQYGVAHYGDQSGYQDFATEAVDSAAQEVDFSDYDNDNDGYIDGLHIIFAGWGEEAGASSDHIWSHKWNIFSEPEYNNTIINVYSCSPECSGSNGTTLTAIGVICHELGHVFGAPDYYDTDYSGSGGQYPGLGQWDIMSSGSWNMSGRTPASHNAYTKAYIYRWSTVDTLDSPQQVTVHAGATTSGDIYRINTSTEGDFFLLENRQQHSWDDALPGHGMLVYHVHPNVHGASVSNASHPQGIYLLASTSVYDTFPTATVSSYGTVNASNTPLPGTARRHELTDYSIPWLRPWSKVANNTPMTYISENTRRGTVSFCFKGVVPYSDGLQAEGVTDSGLFISWNNYGSLDATIVLSTSNNFTPLVGTCREGDTLAGGDIVVYQGAYDNQYIDGLLPGTTYWVRLYTNLTDSTYSDSVYTASATTLTCGATLWVDLYFESLMEGQLPTCWSNDANTPWSVNTVDGNRVLTVTLPGNMESITSVIMPPFYVQGETSEAVASLSVRYEGQDDSSTLYLLYRNSVTESWDTVRAAITEHRGDWCTYYYNLDAPGIYNQMGMLYRSRGNQTLYVDSIRLRSGILLYAQATEGGDITPQGYVVGRVGDTITFAMTRHPGYRFSNIFVDGYSRLSRVDMTGDVPTYAMPITQTVSVKATFERDLAMHQLERAPLTVYPNPTTGVVSVSNIPEDVNMIAVYNLQGVLLQHQSTDGASVVTLDLHQLPAGHYVLRVGNQVRRIVKE